LYSISISSPLNKNVKRQHFKLEQEYIISISRSCANQIVYIDKYKVSLYTNNVENKKHLMKVGKVAQAAGVSVSTVHYYLREGLLNLPPKTSRNMAYYDPSTVEEIRLIKELQTHRFLPLSAIKLILEARRSGQTIGHVLEMKSVLEDIFHPVPGNETYKAEMTLSELVVTTGLSETNIKTLEKMRLIEPDRRGSEPIYSDIDVSIARLFKRVRDYGLKAEDLFIYTRFARLIKIEAQAMHDTIHKLPNHEILPMAEMFKTTSDLKNLLAIRAWRDIARMDHENHLNQGMDQ
jgi:DNA-binding transcriptional MerR regulator